MKQPISLGELAVELGINKSKLAYYFQIGLIEPSNVVGKMLIFDKPSTVKRLVRIDEFRKKNHSLKQIKKLLANNE